MIRPHTVLWLSALAGCTETIQLTRDPLESLVALEITPGDAMVTITDLAASHHTLQLSAMGRFVDGSLRDVTPLVVWEIDNGLLGSVDPHGLFTATHRAAGHAVVTIAARDMQASAALTVIIDATIIDASFPPPQANLFAPINPVVTGDPTNAPKLIYPADATMFPQNISRTLFQYQRGATNDAFRLLFDSDVLHLRVETGADRWEADGDLQRLLADTGIAGAIHAEVQGTLSTGPGTIYAGNRIKLEFSREPPGGPLLYWSAATNGIMRGDVDISKAGKLYPSGSTNCVGCHAVSRDGRQLALGYDNMISVDLQTIDLGSLDTKIAASPSRPMGWATFSPDGTHVLVANNGILTLYESDTGNQVSTVPLPQGRYATHPDWSPDGTYIAVALTGQTPNNLEVKAASIARIPYSNGSWGVPEILVPGAATNNNYFPKYSPDGAFIAYVRATSASQGATSAELMLVGATGGMPRRLRLASSRVGTFDDVPDLSNTMPSWSPRKDGRAWLAFVSARPYGTVLPTGGRGQIWVTSLDLTSTNDPSTPAFWLPCQDVTVLNNNPVWSNSDLTQ